MVYPHFTQETEIEVFNLGKVICQPNLGPGCPFPFLPWWLTLLSHLFGISSFHPISSQLPDSIGRAEVGTKAVDHSPLRLSPCSGVLPLC